VYHVSVHTVLVELKNLGGAVVQRPNTQDIACILVYVSFMVIVDNKKFKTC